jgi:O-antigen/teichoic acid export membrane protein
MQGFQVLRYAGLLLTGVLLAKSPLDTGSIGLYEALLLVSGFTGFFWIGGLLNALVPLYRSIRRQAADQPTTGSAHSLQAAQQGLLGEAFRSSTLLNAALVVLLVFLPEPWRALLGLNNCSNWVWGLFCAFVFFNNPAYLAEYVYLVREESRALLVYGVLVFSGQLLAVGLPPMLGMGLEASVAGMALTALLRWGWLLHLLGPSWRSRAEKKLRSALRTTALPLAGSLLLGGTAMYLDGFIVAGALGQEALAVFRYGARELPLVLLLANAFSTAASADVAEDLQASLGLIRERSRAMLRRFAPITVAMMLSSHWWFPKVFRPEFAQSHEIFDIYLLLLIPRLLFPQTILTGLGVTKIMFWISGAELALNAALSLLLIGPMGMQGVAWATVIASVADKLLLVGYNRRNLNLHPSTYIHGPAFVGYSLILAVAYLVSVWMAAT